MRWNTHCLSRGVLASTLLLAFASNAGPAPQFRVIPLSLGGKHCQVAAIKDGRAVGSASPTAKAPKHAFLWTEADGMKDLGTLGGNYSAANGARGAASWTSAFLPHTWKASPHRLVEGRSRAP